METGAWWATVHGVAQGGTGLKRFSVLAYTKHIISCYGKYTFPSLILRPT